MTEDRDDGGKFTSGNQAAAGSRRGQAHELREWFRNAVTEEDLQAVAAALVSQAKQGDTRAAALLLDRLYGRVRLEPVTIPALPGETRTGAIVGAWIAAVQAGEVGAEEAAAAAQAIRVLSQAQDAAECADQNRLDLELLRGD